MKTVAYSEAQLDFLQIQGLGKVKENRELKNNMISLNLINYEHIFQETEIFFLMVSRFLRKFIFRLALKEYTHITKTVSPYLFQFINNIFCIKLVYMCNCEYKQCQQLMPHFLYIIQILRQRLTAGST